MHVAAVEKVTASYEHIAPERVGNRRRIVVSELSGPRQRPHARRRAGRRRAGQRARAARAHQGAGEPGLPVRGGRGLVRAARPAQRSPATRPPFEVLDVVVISERRRGNSMFAEATVKLRIGDEIVHTVAEGDGPGARARRRLPQGAEPALPAAARRPPGRLQGPHPRPEAATGAKTRVLIEAARGARSAGAPSASRRTSSRPAPRRWPTRWSCRWCGRAARARRHCEGPRRAPPAAETTERSGARRRRHELGLREAAPHPASPRLRGEGTRSRARGRAGGVLESFRTCGSCVSRESRRADPLAGRVGVRVTSQR